MVRFYHCNHSVLDIERSCAFYAEQFGLRVMRQLTAYEGALRLAFLGNDASDFRLELTWNRDRKTPMPWGKRNSMWLFIRIPMMRSFKSIRRRASSF